MRGDLPAVRPRAGVAGGRPPGGGRVGGGVSRDSRGGSRGCAGRPAARRRLAARPARRRVGPNGRRSGRHRGTLGASSLRTLAAGRGAGDASTGADCLLLPLADCLLLPLEGTVRCRVGPRTGGFPRVELWLRPGEVLYLSRWPLPVRGSPPARGCCGYCSRPHPEASAACRPQASTYGAFCRIMGLARLPVRHPGEQGAPWCPQPWRPTLREQADSVGSASGHSQERGTTMTASVPAPLSFTSTGPGEDDTGWG